MTTILKRGVFVAAAAIIAAIAVAGAAKAEDKKFTVAIIMPSLDISYWQWVAYGAKTKAQELGMNSMSSTPMIRRPSRCRTFAPRSPRARTRSSSVRSARRVRPRF